MATRPDQRRPRAAHDAAGRFRQPQQGLKRAEQGAARAIRGLDPAAGGRAGAVPSGAQRAKAPDAGAVVAGSLDALLAEVRACRLCEAHLPAGPRPVLQMSAGARILVAGQAPGRRVHASGVPFDDPSGDRLRDWLGVTREVFYDPTRFAIVPMGFCYPGTGKSGDLPPRPECAPAWRARLLAHLGGLELTLVIGQYAHAYHFGAGRRSLTETVRGWRARWPSVVPLPHPSPRNNLWLRKNPWFEAELVPALRERVAAVLAG